MSSSEIKTDVSSYSIRDIREFLTEIEKEIGLVSLHQKGILWSSRNLLQGKSVENLLKLMNEKGVEKLYFNNKWWLCQNGDFENKYSSRKNKYQNQEEYGTWRTNYQDLDESFYGEVFWDANDFINPFHKKSNAAPPLAISENQKLEPIPIPLDFFKNSPPFTGGKAPESSTMNSENIESEQAIKELAKFLGLSDDTIGAAIINDPSIPPPKQTKKTVLEYVRDQEVVKKCLSLANGICGKCKKPAPFNRLSDKTPFLEVHHIRPLSQDGSDTLENTIALCPNCHRETHDFLSFNNFKNAEDWEQN